MNNELHTKVCTHVHVYNKGTHNLTSGKSFANETATIIPSKKKFFDANFFALSKVDGVESAVSPPLTASARTTSSLMQPLLDVDDDDDVLLSTPNNDDDDE